MIAKHAVHQVGKASWLDRLIYRPCPSCSGETLAPLEQGYSFALWFCHICGYKQEQIL